MKKRNPTRHSRRSREAELASALVEKDTVLSWRDFPRTDCIRRWVEQVKTRPRSTQDWSIIGSTLFIEHPSPRAVEALAQLIATELQMGFIALDPDHDSSCHTPERLQGLLGKVVFLLPGSWQNADETCGPPDPAMPQGRARVLLERNVVRRLSVVISTTRSFTELAAPLQRVTAFDRVFTMPLPSKEELGQLVIDLCGSGALSDEVRCNPEQLGRLVAPKFPGHEQRLRLSLAIRQRAAALARPLIWSDLVLLAANGLSESDPEPPTLRSTRERVAWHEAGHALVAILDSDGVNMPEAVTILTNASCLGLVMASLDHTEAATEACTRAIVEHDIRVLLAGRAAEELIYGVSGISDLCETDLDDAARRTQKAFSSWGIELVSGDSATSAAQPITATDAPSAFPTVWQDQPMRDFLVDHYRATRDLIRGNQALLDALYKELLTHEVLFRSELEKLYGQKTEADAFRVPHQPEPATTVAHLHCNTVGIQVLSP